MNDETNLTTLPIVPVKRTVLFPGVMMPLTIGRPRSISAVEAASKSEDKTLLIVAQRQPDLEQPAQSDLYTIGTKAIIKQIGRTPDGQLHTLVQGVDRQVLIKVERLDPFLEGRARPLLLPGESGAEADALHRAIIDLTGELTKLVQTSGVTEALLSLGMDPDPVALAYRVASLLNLTLAEEQALLEASTREDLLRNVYAALAREVQERLALVVDEGDLALRALEAPVPDIDVVRRALGFIVQTVQQSAEAASLLARAAAVSGEIEHRR